MKYVVGKRRDRGRGIMRGHWKDAVLPKPKLFAALIVHSDSRPAFGQNPSETTLDVLAMSSEAHAVHRAGVALLHKRLEVREGAPILGFPEAGS
jgi:hypothetical protein